MELAADPDEHGGTVENEEAGEQEDDFDIMADDVEAEDVADDAGPDELAREAGPEGVVGEPLV